MGEILRIAQRATTSGIVVFVAILAIFSGAAHAECYLSLSAQSGFSRAGPYPDRATCEAYARRMFVNPNCSCGRSGPSPEELERQRIANEIHVKIEEGNALYRDKRYAEAIAAYNAALALGPSSVAEGNIHLAQYSMALARGYQLTAAGDWDGAIAAFNEAVSVATTDPSAALKGIRRAQYHKACDRGHQMWSKDWQGAIDAYREALTYEPGDQVALDNLHMAEAALAAAQAYQRRQTEYHNAYDRIKQGIDDYIATAAAAKNAHLGALAGSGSTGDAMQGRKSLPTLVFGDVDSLEDVHRESTSGIENLGGLLGAKPQPPIKTPEGGPVGPLPASPFAGLSTEARADPEISAMVGWYKKLEEQKQEAVRKLDEIRRQQTTTPAPDLADKQVAVATQIKRIETDQKTAIKEVKAVVRRKSYASPFPD